jgi:hypothetical protein
MRRVLVSGAERALLAGPCVALAARRIIGERPHRAQRPPARRSAPP